MTTPPPTDGLVIAVPRGALMRETLDRLDAIGIDTSEVRSNDRKLLFADVGIVTMRPSDVPTYVEAGAADVGITGKDVLAEQPDREVYELLDLEYGKCTMVLATVDGPDPSVEALRRLGVMRVATKYYKTAAAYFEATGRQAEIVEVKGSVELAPLTGLVEAIVDLTATGLLKVLRGGLVVLRRDAHDAEPPQGLGRRIGPGDGCEDHPAGAVAEVQQLVDLALGLLGQHVLTRDADIRCARLDVGRHVGGAHRHDADVGEQELAVVGAHLARVDSDRVEAIQRALHQRAPRDGDRQARRAHDDDPERASGVGSTCSEAAFSSPVRAMCSRSIVSAKPTAGSERPKRPSNSS